MNTPQDWINHFEPSDLVLQEKFLNLNIEDCKEVLKKMEIPCSEGEQFESAENRVFGFEDVVVKFYRPGRWSEEALKEEVLFLKDLEEANVPFIRLAAELSSWNNIHYLVFKRVKDPVIFDLKVLDEDSVRKMVHGVARIHEVGEKRQAPFRAQFNPRAMSEGCFEIIKRAGFLPDSLKSRYERSINRLIEKVDALGEIPIQRIHGDIYSGNTLWKDGEPIFMDLDDFEVGPIALDLKLLSFSWRLDTLDESLDRRERRKIQHNLVLDMYREVRPFPLVQEEVLPLLSAYRDIQFDAWFSSRWKEPGFAKNYEDDDISDPQYWEGSICGLEESLN